MRLSRLLGVVTLGAAVSLTAGAYAADEHKAEEKKAEGEHKGGGEHKEGGGEHKGGGHEGGGHEGGHHGRLPLALAERPLTLPKFVLNIEGEVAFERERECAVTECEHLNALGIAVSAHFGITDDLEVGAIVLPLRLAFPTAGTKASFRYTAPQVEATYRFLKGNFELGGRLGVTVLIPEEGGKAAAIIQPGVPALLHIGEQARLDFGLFIPILAASGGAATAGLNIPVRFIYDIIEPLHVGAQTGFQIRNFRGAKDSIAVPLGIVAGYAIKGEHGPLLDIDPFFTWPQLVDTSPAPSKANPGAFEVGVALGGFLYL